MEETTDSLIDGSYMVACRLALVNNNLGLLQHNLAEVDKTESVLEDLLVKAINLQRRPPQCAAYLSSELLKIYQQAYAAERPNGNSNDHLSQADAFMKLAAFYGERSNDINEDSERKLKTELKGREVECYLCAMQKRSAGDGEVTGKEVAYGRDDLLAYFEGEGVETTDPKIIKALGDFLGKEGVGVAQTMSLRDVWVDINLETFMPAAGGARPAADGNGAVVAEDTAARSSEEFWPWFVAFITGKAQSISSSFFSTPTVDSAPHQDNNPAAPAYSKSL
ncbi:MAG: hypothetical protein V3V61_07440 [Gammaproteobacteria bacterium]